MPRQGSRTVLMFPCCITAHPDVRGHLIGNLAPHQPAMPHQCPIPLPVRRLKAGLPWRLTTNRIALACELASRRTLFEAAKGSGTACTHLAPAISIWHHALASGKLVSAYTPPLSPPCGCPCGVRDLPGNDIHDTDHGAQSG
ncbi:hypothetical protein CALVIDRAFT_129512 [Calocera viscosa TUFC12733]|uniref:Uncharacterized protein n=1 Tax=Calocera viscosa (strain TUFC12733) TaxID=1330018 RepID=A0A167RTF0_CALVF|nr:hypothetical protein CALVIDRAFT_129512 [Calocera viscosa TUFC12733]